MPRTVQGSQILFCGEMENATIVDWAMNVEQELVVDGQEIWKKFYIEKHNRLYKLSLRESTGVLPV